jgi:hypothetical protein
MRILYVRNGLEDKLVDIAVNGAEPSKVRAIMRSWNTVTVPVTFHAGDNDVEISYSGKLGFDLDNVVFYKEGAK